MGADLVCVVSPANAGWVLESIARSVVSELPGDGHIHWGTDGIPPCDAVFYTHYSLWMQALRSGTHPKGAAALVFFTHPSHPARSWPWVSLALNRCTRVLSMSSLHARSLHRHGVAKRKLTVEIPGVESDRFPPHERSGGGSVMICSAYYERKAGDIWLAVARLLPHRQFQVVGRGWDTSPFAQNIASLDNVTLLQLPYERYGSMYAASDVYLSTSRLEGGPIPLIEAMLANVMPVVSATGFAPDIVDDGTTGFVFPVGADAETVADLVERAYSAPGYVRSAVEHLTPARFARAVWAELEGFRANRPSRSAG